MLNDICSEAKESMGSVVSSLKKQLASIRTGRASTSMLDGVKVDYYGSLTPLAQVSSLTVPDARMIVVKPWEKGIIKDVLKAILEANLGLNPVIDSDIVRVPIPALTEDRRRDYVKQAKGKCEDAKIATRNVRRDYNEMLKSAKKDAEISEDDERKGLKMIQDLTDDFIQQIDVLMKNKETDIMQI